MELNDSFKIKINRDLVDFIGGVKFELFVVAIMVALEEDLEYDDNNYYIERSTIGKTIYCLSISTHSFKSKSIIKNDNNRLSISKENFNTAKDILQNSKSHTIYLDRDILMLDKNLFGSNTILNLGFIKNNCDKFGYFNISKYKTLKEYGDDIFSSNSFVLPNLLFLINSNLVKVVYDDFNHIALTINNSGGLSFYNESKGKSRVLDTKRIKLLGITYLQNSKGTINNILKSDLISIKKLCEHFSIKLTNEKLYHFKIRIDGKETTLSEELTKDLTKLNCKHSNKIVFTEYLNVPNKDKQEVPKQDEIVDIIPEQLNDNSAYINEANTVKLAIATLKSFKRELPNDKIKVFEYDRGKIRIECE